MSTSCGGCFTNTPRARRITLTPCGRSGCSNDGIACACGESRRSRRRTWWSPYDQRSHWNSKRLSRRTRRARIHRQPVRRTAGGAAACATGQRGAARDCGAAGRARPRDRAGPGPPHRRRDAGRRTAGRPRGPRRSERADARRSARPPWRFERLPARAGRRVQPAARSGLRSRLRLPVDPALPRRRARRDLPTDCEGPETGRRADLRRGQRNGVGAAARERARRRVRALRRADAARTARRRAWRCRLGPRGARRRPAPLSGAGAAADARRAALAAAGESRDGDHRSVSRRTSPRMDRDMPSAVTYWTGVWQPGREALSNEVQVLRDLNGGRAPVVSFSSGQRSRVSIGERVIRLSAERWALLRAVAAAVEPRGAVTHVFGALDEWHLLRAVGRRPVVFTVALPGRAIDPVMARKVT